MKSYFKNGFQLLPNDKRSTKNQYKSYQDNLRNNFSNPNTTDIHALKGISNITNYIIKYMTKLEAGKRCVIGAVWGASNELKKIDYPRINDYDNKLFFDLVNLIENDKTIRQLPKINDFVSLFVGKIYKGIREKYKSLWTYIKSHYSNKERFYKIPFYQAVNNIQSIVKKIEFKQPIYKQLEIFPLTL